MRPLHVSHIRDVRDTAPSPACVSWDALARRLTSPPPVRADLCPPRASESTLRRLKGQLPAWLPAEFRPGAPRTTAGVALVHLLVLDYDSGAPMEQEQARWDHVAHVGHTTWSHTRSDPRFRVVIPLARAVSPNRWGRVFHWVSRRTGGLVDRQTCNADRLYFLPAIQSSASPWDAWQTDGPWLDLDVEDLQATPEEMAIARRRARALARQQRPDRQRQRPRAVQEDPAVRREIVEALGGKVYHRATGPIGVGLPCPSCGRHDVWAPIEPLRSAAAYCNHRRTCGWVGGLNEIQGSN